MRQNLILPALLLFLSSLLDVSAQQSAFYERQFEKYRKAKELIVREKYGSAQPLLSQLLESGSPGLEASRPDMVFYDALCAAELEHEDASYKFNNYLDKYPEHGLTNEARYYLGKLYFNDNKFGDAQRSLQKVRPSRLKGASRDEYYFMLGYSSLRNNDTRTAKNFFSRVSSKNQELSRQSYYYIGHIDYLEGNQDEALETFQKLESDRRYHKIIPAYKLQIYHQLGDYKTITASADEWLESAGSVNKSEAARIIGDAWYHMGDHAEAMKYMEIFERTSRRTLSREDRYLMGYTYYRNGEYQKALNNFQKATASDDSLTQMAFYYIGSCYNMAGEKKYAANAFLSAFKANIDHEITEESLFNFIKITLETGYDPYNEAVAMLEEYLRNNPASDRKDEAYSYLADLYLNSKNYKQALASIENVQTKNTSLEAVYQKILYFRAIELFNSNDLESSIALFKKASEYLHDETIRCESNFWIGECFYRQSNFWATLKYSKDFLNCRGARSSDNLHKAYYNLGYSYFNRKEYVQAIANFKKFDETNPVKHSKTWADAMLRIGDSYFITGQYSPAISYYDRVLQAGTQDVDYALYQKALSLGARGNYKGKTENLKALINHHTGSRYRDDAMYEAALTYTIAEDDLNALAYFDKLIQSYPNSSYSATAYLKKGFIYYNRNEYESAINTFKKAISKYPASKESQEALAALKNIYLDMNRISDYYSYAKGLSFAEVSASEEDSLNYSAAENIYLQGDYQRATRAFETYIEQFPQGGYLDHARFYLAECYLKTGQEGKAQQEYKALADRPRSSFSEDVLLKLSTMLYEAGQYEEALNYYRRLEDLAEYQQNLVTAMAGQMHCHFRTGQYNATIQTGKRILGASKVPDELMQEAHLTLARSYFEEGLIEESRQEYSTLTNLVSNEWAAEAYYYLALIDSETGRDEEAENRIFELSDKLAVYDYWVAKGFILLADIYVKGGNTFQAKQTLQSIIDNYDGPELVEIARNKLKSIESSEQQNQQ